MKFVDTNGQQFKPIQGHIFMIKLLGITCFSEPGKDTKHLYFRNREPSKLYVNTLVKKRVNMSHTAWLENTMILAQSWPKMLLRVRELERINWMNEKVEKKGMDRYWKREGLRKSKAAKKRPAAK